MAVIVVTGIATFLARMNATNRFDAVNEGKGRHVTFARTDGVTHNEQPVLIGSTTNFFFLYYANRKVTEIVPVENTALMTVDLQPKKVQTQASPAGGAPGDTPRLSP
jgi:hypothetical protein